MSKIIVWYLKKGILKNVLLDNIDEKQAREIVENNFCGIYISSHLIHEKQDIEYYKPAIEK